MFPDCMPFSHTFRLLSRASIYQLLSILNQPITRPQATNIAETSVTINGVRVVVDAGLVKKRVHLARSGMDCLTTMGMRACG
jgi:hypothetical protein